MVVTSRPAGLKEALFDEHFERLQLRALTEEQQHATLAETAATGYGTLYTTPQPHSPHEKSEHAAARPPLRHDTALIKKGIHFCEHAF